DTPEDRAAAYGFRLKADELLGHNLHRASARARREWRRSFRRQRRHWQNYADKWQRDWGRHWQQQAAQQTQAAAATAAAPMAAAAPAAAGAGLPLLAVINAALFVTWILVMLSAFMTRTIFGWPLPEEVPMWGSLLILFALYLVFTGPIRAARHAHLAWGGPY